MNAHQHVCLFHVMGPMPPTAQQRFLFHALRYYLMMSQRDFVFTDDFVGYVKEQAELQTVKHREQIEAAGYKDAFKLVPWKPVAMVIVMGGEEPLLEAAVLEYLDMFKVREFYVEPDGSYHLKDDELRLEVLKKTGQWMEPSLEVFPMSFKCDGEGVDGSCWKPPIETIELSLEKLVASPLNEMTAWIQNLGLGELKDDVCASLLTLMRRLWDNPYLVEVEDTSKWVRKCPECCMWMRKIPKVAFKLKIV